MSQGAKAGIAAPLIPAVLDIYRIRTGDALSRTLSAVAFAPARPPFAMGAPGDLRPMGMPISQAAPPKGARALAFPPPKAGAHLAPACPRPGKALYEGCACRACP